MKTLHTIVVVLGGFLVGLAGRAQGAWTWTVMPFPAPAGSFVYGVSGDKVVGSYNAGTGGHGFVYDVGTGACETLDIPGATHTALLAIDGSNIVGCAPRHSFLDDGPRSLHDGAGWKSVGGPFPFGGSIYGISGNRMVGYLYDFTRDRGSLYDGQSWTYFDYPGSSGTVAYGIDGDGIVGSYSDSSNRKHGFIYNSTNATWAALDFPDATETVARDICGNNIVGWYRDATGIHGFLYDGVNWTSLSHPDGPYTELYGISGNHIVGMSWIREGDYLERRCGVLLTVPEPATLAVLALGGMFVLRRRSA